MRKFLPMLAVVALFAGASLLVRADEGKKETIKGMAACAKCTLKEGSSCQNVVITKEDGKEVKHYLVMNDVSKKAHAKLGFCTAKKGDGPTVKVTGTCVEKDGKLTITPESIEKAE